jgi:Protein of unknown function (DUF3054)
MPGPSEPNSRRLAPARLPSRRSLVAADAIALATFVAVGLRSHHVGAVLEIVMRNAMPIAVAWAAVSAIVGTYRRRDVASLVTSWAIGVPLGLLARTWWVGSPRGARIAVFLGVGLAFTFLFLVIGRGAVAVVTRTRPAWRRSVVTQ